MLGTTLKIGAHIAPHLLKGLGTTAILGGGAYGLGVGATGLVNKVAPDFVKDVYRGTIEGDEDGVFKGKGPLAAIIKPIIEEQKLEQAKQQKDVTKALGPTGYSIEDLGLGAGATRFDAMNAVGRKNRVKEEDQRKQDRRDQLLPLIMQYQQADKRAAEANNLALQQLGLAQQTRADSMLMRADDLKLQREMLAREDRRYNDKLERDERLDREKAFIALMGGGLDALGAAFA